MGDWNRADRWMNTSPRTVTPETTVLDAVVDMWHHGVRHLPIDSGRHLVGVLANIDLYHAVPLHMGSTTGAVAQLALSKVEDAMNREPVTVAPDAPLVEAARTMTEKGLDALPFVDGERCLLGILTSRDALLGLAEQVPR